jgi:hypothetical protein
MSSMEAGGSVSSVAGPDPHTKDVGPPPGLAATPGSRRVVAHGDRWSTGQGARSRETNSCESWGAFPPAAFIGSWHDSLGHQIAVTMGSEYCDAVLSKPGQQPKKLQIRPASVWHCSWLWTWRCGNGCLDWKQSSASTVVWHTERTGVSSTWKRTKEADKPIDKVTT